MLKEFKEFTMKGNVVDLAVAVIIGGAFGKIVTSLVGDVIMPVIGMVMGGIDFKTLAYKFVGMGLDGTQKVVELKYGLFVQTVVDFVIIAFCIFLMIKLMSKAMPKKDDAPAGPTDVELLGEIRDLLKKKA
jgi:large conductance mechanosensitive channel